MPHRPRAAATATASRPCRTLLLLLLPHFLAVARAAVFDCPNDCAIPDEDAPDALSFCAARANFRACPAPPLVPADNRRADATPSWAELDRAARRDVLVNVSNYLRSIDSVDGAPAAAFNLTRALTSPRGGDQSAAQRACANQIRAVACAVVLPVCEVGRHTQRLCSKSMREGLHDDCDAVLGKNAADALADLYGMNDGDSAADGAAAAATPGSAHTEAAGCFPLDYGGPSYFQWVIGFLLCLVFAALSSLALNLQKQSLNEADQLDVPTPLCKQWKWVLGMCILVTGSIVDFVAYGLAPQSVLTPLGGMVLVWNILISSCCFGEKSGAREWVSTGIIFAGTSLSVVFADHYTPTYTADDIISLYSRPAMVWYMVLVPIFAGGHYGLLKYIQSNGLAGGKGTAENNHWVWQTLECIAYAGTAGTLGAQAILFAKQIMELLKANAQGDGTVWTRWQTYIILLAIPFFLFCNITFLNAGLRHYSALQTVPIYQTYWMIVGTVSGLIYFREIDEMSDVAIGLFWVGILTSVVGIAILSGKRPERLMTARERLDAAKASGGLANRDALDGAGGRDDGGDDNDGGDGQALSSVSLDSAGGEGRDKGNKAVEAELDTTCVIRCATVLVFLRFCFHRALS